MIGTSRTVCAPHPRRSIASCGASNCTLALLVWASALATGCAGGGNRALQPRTRDVAALQREAASNPTAPEPWYQMSLAHAAEQRFDAALRASHAAVQRDTDYEPALTFMAKLFFESGRSNEGVRYFSSRALDAWSEPVRINVALLLADVGHYDSARALLESSQHGEHALAARVNLAYLDWLEGDLARADAEFAALEGRLDSPALRNNAALARLRRGNVEESAAMLEEIAGPGLPAASGNLALVLRHWMFDEERAAVHEARALGSEAPQLSAAVLSELLTPGSAHEDAAPRPAQDETGTK